MKNKMKKQNITRAAATLGKIGGQAKSDKKQESSRKNGRLGGRPKKKAQ